MNKYLFTKPYTTLGSDIVMIPSCWWNLDIDETEEKEKAMSGLDKSIVESIGRKIARRVERKDIFSAFDITKRIRAKFSDDEISHAAVREVVADWFEDAMDEGWERSLIELENGKVTWVCHHNSVSPKDYPGFVRLVNEKGCGSGCTCVTPPNESDTLRDLIDSSSDFIERVDKYISGFTTLKDLEAAMQEFNDAVDVAEKNA